MATQWTEPTPTPDPAKGSGMDAVTVLLTRPAAQSTDFARQLATRLAQRIRPLIAPLMETELLSPRLPVGPYGAVIFTSMAGVLASMRLDQSLPNTAICVGKATAVQAEAAGFEATSADGAAEDLIALIARTLPGQRLLHLHGAVSQGDIAQRLTRMGVPTDEVVVYRQLAVPLSAEAIATLGRPGPVIVPLFSPRSARLFRDQLPQTLGAELSLALISPAVAEAAADIPARHRLIAAEPTATSMLEAIGTLLDQLGPT